MATKNFNAKKMLMSTLAAVVFSFPRKSSRIEPRYKSEKKGDKLIRVYHLYHFRDSGGIQTHNLLIRSQMLYSVELRNHSAPHYLICGCKGTHFFRTNQTFWRLF